MRQLRNLSLLSALSCLIGLAAMVSLNSCGGGSSSDRSSSGSFDPIVVLTVIESNGHVVGGAVVSESGVAINTPAVFSSFPVRLEVRAYDPNTFAQLRQGSAKFDSAASPGEHNGWKNILKKSGYQLEDISGDGSDFAAVVEGVTAADLRVGSCPDDTTYLSVTYNPDSANNPGNYNTTTNRAYQDMSYAISPLVAAWVVYEGVTYDLAINQGKPTKIPNTRANYLPGGGPEPYEVTFDLFVTVRGSCRSYWLVGNSHISETDLNEELVMDCGGKHKCSSEKTFSFTISGTSPNGGPLLANLHLVGSLWEIGDPQAGNIDPNRTGEINSITPSTITVNGRLYNHNAGTSWRDAMGNPVPKETFLPGMQVRVTGVLNNDGSFYATSVQEL